MRARFELYRAFDQDSRDNRDALARNGKLQIPVLAVHGEISNTGPRMEGMMRQVADRVTTLVSLTRRTGYPKKTRTDL